MEMVIFQLTGLMQLEITFAVSRLAVSMNLPTVLPLTVTSKHQSIKATLRVDHRVQWELYLSGWLASPDLEVEPLIVMVPDFGSERAAKFTCHALPPRGGMTNESGRSFRYNWTFPPSWKGEQPDIFVHWLPKPPPVFRQLEAATVEESSSEEEETDAGTESEGDEPQPEREQQSKWTRWF